MDHVADLDDLRARANELERRRDALAEWRSLAQRCIATMVATQTRMLALQRSLISQARIDLHENAWHRTQREIRQLVHCMDELHALRLRAEGRVLELEAAAAQHLLGALG